MKGIYYIYEENRKLLYNKNYKIILKGNKQEL